MVDWLSQTVLSVGDHPVTLAELFGFVFGAASVALAVKERISTFPVGIVMSVMFGVLFVNAGLYANAWLQVIYVVLGLWGWVEWHRRDARRDARVQHASRALLIALALVTAIAVAVLVPVLDRANDPAPLLDGLTTGLSLAAQALLNLKRVETWYVWIVVDVIYVPFYASQGLWLTAIVYVGFLGLCVLGLREWRRGAAPVLGAPLPATP